MRHIYIIFLFIALFGLGNFISPYLDPYIPDFIYVPNVVKKTDTPQVPASLITQGVDPQIAQAAEVKNIIDSGLQPSINTDDPFNEESTYKNTRKTILDSYNSGKRDEKTVQSFLYLSSLENNVSLYKKASEEWCRTDQKTCESVKMPVFITGTVFDEKGIVVPGVKLTISGDESFSAVTNSQGRYALNFTTLHPRRIRLLAHHPEFAGGSHTFTSTDPRLLLGVQNQIFEKDFTLVRAVQKVELHTVQKKILSGDATVTPEGFLIENSFSKYLLPFGSIRFPDGKPYNGKVLVSVFEFNRQTANEFLQSDVFSEVHGFASQGLVTYSMPLIFFYDDKGKRLEIFKDKPMTVWTTNRELQALVEENAQGVHQPGFNPAEYEEAASIENVAKYVAADEQKAYQESQKNPNAYPITMTWILRNYSRLPGFFVYDQSTGLWEAVGYSLVAPSTNIKHSIRSPFWTKV